MFEGLVTDHGLPLRKAAGVSEEAMERVYAMLRELDVEHLTRMYAETDPYDPIGLLARHQIAFTIERKLDGRW